MEILRDIKIATTESLAILAPDDKNSKFRVAIVNHAKLPVVISHEEEFEDRPAADMGYLKRAAFGGRNAYQLSC